jgi:hypothetical protein
MTGRAAALSGMVELPIWADNANITLGAGRRHSLRMLTLTCGVKKADAQGGGPFFTLAQLQ